MRINVLLTGTMVRMGNPVLAIVIWLTVFSCFSHRYEPSLPARKVDLLFHLDIARLDSGLIVLDDTISQYQIGRYNIYRYAIKEVADMDMTRTIGSHYAYFICERDSTAGLIFSTVTDSIGEKMSVDSFRKSKTFSEFEPYNHNFSLLGTTILNKDTFMQKYVSDMKKAITDPDTVYVHYSRPMNGLEYTLSRSFDSIGKTKVYKVHIITNKRQREGGGHEFPRREYLFQLKVEPVDNGPVLEKIIKKFSVLQKPGKGL